jgi:hypothetical protein
VADWGEIWSRAQKGSDGKREEEMKSKHSDRTRRPKKVGYASFEGIWRNDGDVKLKS